MKTTWISGMIVGLALAASPCGAQQDFQSAYYAVGLSRISPALSYFSVDSLGQGKLQHNPILKESPAAAGFEFSARHRWFRLHAQVA